MKNFYFKASTLLLMAALMASCAKESVETTSGNTGRSILYKAAFGTNRPGGETRAKEMNVEGLIADNESLPVWVYFRSGTSAGTLFKSWSLTYLTTPTEHWSYNNDVDEIHPADDLMHFSVWPVENITTTGRDATGTPLLDNVDANSDGATFDYTVPALYLDQEDLLVAQANSTYANPSVQFTYHHALSQINFSVKGYTGVKITISNIKMGGICNKGTYSFETDKWSATAGDGAYDYVISPEEPGGPVGQTTGLDDKEVFFGNHDPGTDPEKDIRHANSLMLMPQSFEANTAAWFSFDYVLTNMDDVVLKSGVGVKVSLKDLAIGGNAPVWKEGNRYRYTIQFNKLNTISYTVQVNQWTVGNQAQTVQ
ncbi:MAG: fimbrillin family protein [Alistipes sp.]|jgi:hypothetical protein|nr:fimbrillin family protein [Alistipes sp.]